MRTLQPGLPPPAFGASVMQIVGAFAEFERAMIRERTSAGRVAARAEGRIGGRRKKLDDLKRREIAEAVISGRRTAAQMARMFRVFAPTGLASSPRVPYLTQPPAVVVPLRRA